MTRENEALEVLAAMVSEERYTGVSSVLRLMAGEVRRFDPSLSFVLEGVASTCECRQVDTATIGKLALVIEKADESKPIPLKPKSIRSLVHEVGELVRSGAPHLGFNVCFALFSYGFYPTREDAKALDRKVRQRFARGDKDPEHIVTDALQILGVEEQRARNAVARAR